ncbi:MAG TPA: ATP-binding protein [Lacunisphaera sp.]
MRSLGFRLAFWYALASVLTLGCFFWVGRHLLEQHMLHSLDTGLKAEFEQVKRRLGPDAGSLEAAEVQARLATNASVRFSIEIHAAGGDLLYRSRNLKNHPIPDNPRPAHLVAQTLDRFLRALEIGSPGPASGARRTYEAQIGDLGGMHIGEFPLDGRTVFIAVSNEQVHAMVVAYEEVFYGLLVLMLIVSSVIGFFLSHILLRPLRQIQSTAAHIGSDNLSERIPVSPVEDEMSNLARLLNEMFDRLEAAFHQTRRFTAEASHELKTPLSLIRLQAEKLLVDGGLKPAQEEALQLQLEEIARLNQIIEELLFLSRAEARAITLQTKPQESRVFLESFATDARVLAESRGARFSCLVLSDGPAVFDGRWIRQVLLNLLTNALNVSPPGCTVTLSSEIVAGAWRVAVEDQGPGVPADQRERIFERFVRLAPGNETGGSGLGLAISRSIVKLHRGQIRAEAGSGGRGLRVVFEIPAGTPAGA